jgi:hypothetical protein
MSEAFNSLKRKPKLADTTDLSNHFSTKNPIFLGKTQESALFATIQRLIPFKSL